MSRTPDYVLKALDKSDDRNSGKIGAGWNNDDGSITIALNRFVFIESHPDLLITLFPKDYEQKRKTENDRP